MMLFTRSLKVPAGAAAMMAACFCTVAAHGSVATLEAVQQANPNLVNQWKFEGSDDSSRLLDSKGSQNLTRVAGAGGTVDPDGIPANGNEIVYTPNVLDIVFEQGWDGAASQAYRPAGIPVLTPNVPADAANGIAGAPGNIVAQSRAGAGLATPMYQTPTLVTVETVTKTNVFDSLNAFAYIIQSRIGGSADRLYYLAQQLPDNSRNGGSSISAHIGTAGPPALASRPRVVQDAVNDSWYYIAATYDLTATPAVMNAYFANLSTGGPLTQTVTNLTFAISPAGIATAANARPFGVGMFAINSETAPGSGVFTATGGQEFYRGSIDNLAMYGSVLSMQQIQQNLSALRVPEPTALVLIGIGSMALLNRRRRTT